MKTPRSYRWIFLACALILSACGTPAPESTPVPAATLTSLPPSATATITLTVTVTETPTETFTPTETIPPTFTPTFTPSPTIDWAAMRKTHLSVYLISVVNAETCDFQPSPVVVPSRPKTDDMLKNIEEALRSLFVTKAPQIGYLINPLALSQLEFDHLTYDSQTINVYLSGQVAQTDDLCHDAQASAQVRATISQFLDPSVDIIMWVGPYLLDDLLLR